jgi:hypothetical protein
MVRKLRAVPHGQALELLMVLADSRRYQPLLVPGLQPLLHLSIGVASHAMLRVMLHTPHTTSAAAGVPGAMSEHF